MLPVNVMVVNVVVSPPKTQIAPPVAVALLPITWLLATVSLTLLWA